LMKIMDSLCRPKAVRLGRNAQTGPHAFASEQSEGRTPMKLAVLYIVVVGVILFWWLKAGKAEHRI